MCQAPIKHANVYLQRRSWLVKCVVYLSRSLQPYPNCNRHLQRWEQGKQVRICTTKGKFTKTLHVLVHNSTVPSPTEKRGWPIKSADKIPWNDRQILNFTDRLLRYWSLNMDSFVGCAVGCVTNTQRARIRHFYPLGRDKRLCISCNLL